MRSDQWLSYPAPCTFFFSCPWNEGVAFILSLFSAVVSPHSRLVHIVCLAWLSFVIFFIFCIPGCLLSVHLPKSTHVYAITHSSNTDFSQPISPFLLSFSLCRVSSSPRVSACFLVLVHTYHICRVRPLCKTVACACTAVLFDIKFLSNLQSHGVCTIFEVPRRLAE